MKTNKGISLITLVITIVIMIILAGTIILTLSDVGIISKANEAVEKTNIQQIKELATILWAEQYATSNRSQEALYEAVMTGLKNNEITPDKYEGYRIDVTESGVNVVKIDTATDDYPSGNLPTSSDDQPSENPLAHEGIIPAGGTYKERRHTDDYTSYYAGEAFPSGVYNGDYYCYGDYEYYAEYSTQTGSYTWRVELNTSVVDKYTATTFGEILESINGAPVTIMEYTFQDCTALTAAPTIPTSITNITGTFLGCRSLTGINYSGTSYQWSAITKDNWYSTSGIRVIHCLSDGEGVCPGHDNLSTSTSGGSVCPTCGAEFW